MTINSEQFARVLLLTIDRPARRNCIDAATAAALEAAVRGFAEDDGLDVMVLTGAGGEAFCSGADLGDIDGLAGRPGAWESGPIGATRLADLGKPSIAAVGGYCTAGGLELACACDFRVADSTARFGVLNRRWGVPLVDGGTQRLPRIVGLGNALYLIETGALIDADHALRIGLVQEVVDEGWVVGRALEIAEAMSSYPQRPLRNDRAAALQAHLPLERGLALELELHAGALQDEEMWARLEAFNRGERPVPITPPPSCSGRRRD